MMLEFSKEQLLKWLKYLEKNAVPEKHLPENSAEFIDMHDQLLSARLDRIERLVIAIAAKLSLSSPE